MKGTPSRGKHNRAASHFHCRRCGKHAYHKAHKVCSSCGYGKSAKLRSYNWEKPNK